MQNDSSNTPLGTIISTPDSPSTTKLAFIVTGSARKGQFVMLETQEGKLIARISEIIKTNRYFERAESVQEFERSGKPLTELFPSERWEYLVAEAVPLGVYSSEKLMRSAFPASPGAKVFNAENSILSIFFGLDLEKGLHLGTVEHHNMLVKLNMTRLLQKHFAILAQSGAGKSYLTSCLIEELLDRKPEDGQVATVVIDTHGEYIGFAEDKNYKNRTDVILGRDFRIGVPGLSMGMIAGIMPHMTSVQKRELNKFLAVMNDENRGKVFDFRDVLNKLESSEIKSTTRDILYTLIYELDSTGLFSGYDNPSLQKLTRPGHLTVIDISDMVSLKEKQIIVTYLGQKLFNARRSGAIPPFAFIVEEAHNFAPEGVHREGAISRNIIEKIAREGRKFHACLGLISQRPINLSTTALSQCVTPDTLITLNPEQSVPISKIEKTWPNKKIITYDTENNHLVSSPITNYIKLNPAESLKKVYRVITDSGRAIKATEDHPFWQGGWTVLGELKKGDRIAAMPQQSYFNDTIEPKILVDENSFGFLPYTTKKDKLVERLKLMGLLPLTIGNSKMFILARLLGHIFGDGTLHPSYKNPDGQHLLRMTFSGKNNDLPLIQNDLKELGFSGDEKISTQFRVSNMEFVNYGKHTIKGTSTYFKTGIVALWAMMRALGAPIGDKSINETEIPEWIMKAPKNLKREFLAALMGSEASKIRMGRRSAEQIYLPFSKVENLKDNGHEYAKQIISLLNDLRVKSTCYKRIYALRKDGIKTTQFIISIKRSRRNILDFCKNVGYRYSKDREIQARYVQAYFEYLEHQISKRKNITKAKSRENIRPAYKITPDFKTWLAQRTECLKEGLVWEIVESKEEHAANDVRDITVPIHHSFFANGFLTHNCNTHIILRVTNPYDLKHIGESSEGLTSDVLGTISSLRVGEALIVGEAVNYPLFLKVRERKSKKNERGIALEQACLNFADGREQKERDAKAFM